MKLPLCCLENRLREFISKEDIENIAMDVAKIVKDSKKFRSELKKEYEIIYTYHMEAIRDEQDTHNIWYYKEGSKGGLLYYEGGKLYFYLCEVRK